MFPVPTTAFSLNAIIKSSFVPASIASSAGLTDITTGPVVSQAATATPVPSVAIALSAASCTVPLPPAVYLTVTPSFADTPMSATVSTTCPASAPWAMPLTA